LAFGTVDNCVYCHNADVSFRSEEFPSFTKDLPPDEFGNEIDWSEMIRRGQVQPAHFLVEEPPEKNFDKTLLLEAAWGRIPPAVFPHKEHTQWVDCDTCHPDLFSVKKDSTEHFTMSRILKGEFCGYCHMKVAFPMDACERCHPGMRR
jgi:c(7)-type cytochrome triheme protein